MTYALFAGSNNHKQENVLCTIRVRDIKHDENQKVTILRIRSYQSKKSVLIPFQHLDAKLPSLVIRLIKKTDKIPVNGETRASSGGSVS